MVNPVHTRTLPLVANNTAMALAPMFDQLIQELQIWSILSSLVLVSLLLFSIFILFSLSKSGEKLNLPPNPVRLPIIGNLHQLGKLPHRSLQALSEKYGPLMLLHFGQVPTLVVSSAAMTKEIMTHDTIFCSRPTWTAANILSYGCQDIALAPCGEYWKQVRKLCVYELLSTKRVQQFQNARVEEVEELLNSIRKCCLGQSPVNLSEMLIRSTSNIFRCVIGKSFQGENDSWFGEITKRVVVQLMAFSFGDFFPCLRWIDNITGLIANLKATSVKFHAFFDHLIEEHKTAKGEGEPELATDFVDILLKIQRDDMLNFKLTNDNLKAILQDMFVGGTDTTASTVEWFMAELVRNPRVMKKLQEEVRSTVDGKKEKVDGNDINRMHYLKCVIKEALRLHPPVPFIPRETIKDVTLGGYHIPAKTRVLMNTFAIHRDPKLWTRPEEFLPERFEDDSVEFKGQEDFQYVPFGGGRRGCPGQAFGLAAVENVVANLLYWFDWRLPSDSVLAAESLDMAEVYGIAIHKKAPIHLVPIPYNP